MSSSSAYSGDSHHVTYRTYIVFANEAVVNMYKPMASALAASVACQVFPERLSQKPPTTSPARPVIRTACPRHFRNGIIPHSQPSRTWHLQLRLRMTRRADTPRPSPRTDLYAFRADPTRRTWTLQNISTEKVDESGDRAPSGTVFVLSAQPVCKNNCGICMQWIA